MNHRTESSSVSRRTKDFLGAQRFLEESKRRDQDPLEKYFLDEEYFDQLHDQIMARLENTDIAPLSKIGSTQKVLKRHWRPWAFNLMSGFFGIVSFMALSTKAGDWFSEVWSSSHTVQVVENQREILDLALSEPETFASSMVSSQSSEDLFGELSEDLHGRGLEIETQKL